MKTVSATITLLAACLELEANLDPGNALTIEVKQTCAFERLMDLTYLNQCDNSAKSPRAMLEYPANITVAANLVKAAKKDSRPNRGSRPALTLASVNVNMLTTLIIYLYTSTIPQKQSREQRVRVGIREHPPW